MKVKATGWVALGFAKEAPNSMKDYDVAIGGVNANGTAYINVREYFLCCAILCIYVQEGEES